LVKRHGIDHTFYLHLVLANDVIKSLGKVIPNLQAAINELSRSKMSSLVLKRLLGKHSNQNFPLGYSNLIRFLSIPKEHLFSRLSF